jgi:hypothetical protein
MDYETVANDGIVLGRLSNSDVSIAECVSVPHKAIDGVGRISVSHITSVVSDTSSDIGEIVVDGGVGVEVASSVGCVAALAQISIDMDVDTNSLVDVQVTSSKGVRDVGSLGPVEGSFDSSGNSVGEGGGEGANSQVRSTKDGCTCYVISDLSDTNDTSGDTRTSRSSDDAVVSGIVEYNTTSNDRVDSREGEQIEHLGLVDHTSSSLPVTHVSSRAGAIAIVRNYKGIPVTTKGGSSRIRDISILEQTNIQWREDVSVVEG